MAGAGTDAGSADRSAGRSADHRTWPQREVRRPDRPRTGVSAGDGPGMANQPRRDLLKGAAATALLVLVTTRSARAAKLLAVRVWPGPDSTRGTLEHEERLKVSHSLSRP